MRAQITADGDQPCSEAVATVLLRADAIVGSRPDLGLEDGMLLKCIQSTCENLGVTLATAARVSMATAAAALDSGERQLLSACAAELEELFDDA